MNLAIKRRTVGAIILLILFVWLSITLYRRYSSVSTPDTLSVPNVPKVPEKVLHELDILPGQPIEAKSPTLVNSSVKPSSNKIQTFSDTKLPPAWVIQLGTFSNEQNAQSLLLKVRRQGYDAYSQTATINGKRLTKVFVGPSISYKGTQHTQQDLETRYHLHGVVQTYRVNLPS